MSELTVFLIAIGFAWVGFPVAQAIGDLFLTFIDVLNAKLSVIISTQNLRIQRIQDEIEPSATSAIGFSAPEEYDEEEEWEEESEPEKKAVGFKIK